MDQEKKLPEVPQPETIEHLNPDAFEKTGECHPIGSCQACVRALAAALSRMQPLHGGDDLKDK